MFAARHVPSRSFPILPSSAGGLLPSDERNEGTNVARERETGVRREGGVRDGVTRRSTRHDKTERDRSGGSESKEG